MPVSNLRPIYRMRLVVTTCSAQLISHCVNAKIEPISIKEVDKMRFSLHIGPTSFYYKSHDINWPLTDFYLVRLSLLKSPALVNDYWTVINTSVTEGSKHFLLRRGQPLSITNRGVPFWPEKYYPKIWELTWNWHPKIWEPKTLDFPSKWENVPPR